MVDYERDHMLDFLVYYLSKIQLLVTRLCNMAGIIVDTQSRLLCKSNDEIASLSIYSY